LIALESHPSITITRADANDGELLALVGRETFLGAFTGRIQHDDLVAFADQRYGVTQQKAELEDSSATFLIGRAGDAIAGYAKLAESAAPACVSAKHPVELERLYLYANWYGRGVGKLLLDWCISEATCQSHDIIWLDV
jgi:GNAT superfamily N-acetyltransferase